MESSGLLVSEIMACSGGARKPNVALVIPVFNEEAVLRRCLEAAVSQTVLAAQIIVVDNGSRDNTGLIVADMQRQYPDHHIVLIEQLEERGLVPTRNAGLDHACADVLGRIDADSVLHAEWVQHVQQLFADPTVHAATGPVTYDDLPLKRLLARIDDALRAFGAKASPTHYPFLYGSNMAIRSTAWRQIRAQTCRDDGDVMHEDIDLTLHLRHVGLRIVYSSAMVSGVSARCIRKTPWEYVDYVDRFERTYNAHDAHNLALRVPAMILRLVYAPLKLAQRLYPLSQVGPYQVRGSRSR